MDANDIVRMGTKAGFDEVVATIFSSHRNYLKVSNSKVDSIVDKLESSASLFLSSKKRVFFTNVDKLEKSSVDAALRKAKRTMHLLQAKEDYNGLAQGPFKYKRGSPADKKIKNASNEDVADIAYASINGAITGGATNVAGMVLVRYTDYEFATSKKAHGSGEQSEARLSLRVFRGSNFSFHDVIASSKLGGIDAEKFGIDSAAIAASTDKVGKIEKGRYDIIYKQSPGGSLVYMTNMMACIGNVETGGFFTGKLGRQVASREINIYDDGNLKEAIDASPYDGEGYPTQRTAVVKEGKLTSYLHNYSTAKKYNTKSTGNAGLVEPDPNVMLFEHKKRVRSMDELVRRTEKGIVITNTWYTRFSNYLTGEFSTVPRDLALYVEKGEVRFAIRQRDVGSMVGIRVNDNIIRMLKNTELAADDTKQSSSWDVGGTYFFMPSILVRGSEISVA